MSKHIKYWMGPAEHDLDMEFLDSVNTFNISTRYPDEKLRFYKLCTKDFAAENFARIKEIRKLILQKIHQ
jgi:hypothetical protein